MRISGTPKRCDSGLFAFGTGVANMPGMQRRKTQRVTRWAVLATAVATLLPGCVISPLPEPPQATINPDLVATDGPVYGLNLHGHPGAASPAGALVRAHDLDSDFPPAQALVEEDGSFLIELATSEDQTEIRLQVIADEARSVPLDLVVYATETDPDPAPRPLSHCLHLSPEAELEAAVEQQVRVVSDCADLVEIAQPYLHRSPIGITVGADLSWPVTLSSGDSVTVVVETDGTFTEEAIFFILASTAEHDDRRPMTVVPPG